MGSQDISIGTSTFTRATSVGGTQVLNQVPIFQVGFVTPTGLVNGVNVTFTVSPVPTGLFLMLFRNGLLQTPGGGNDYTISGSTITFAVAPLSSDVLLAVY